MCSLLAVGIGVSFLIAVIAIVNGMARYVEDDFAGRYLGVNAFSLRRTPATSDGISPSDWRAMSRRPPVTAVDGEAVRGALPAGPRWALEVTRSVVPRTAYVLKGPEVIAHAVTPGYFAIKDLRIARGRLYGPAEEADGAPVVVIGEDVVTRYFPGVDPLGRQLLVDHIPFTVIGVLTVQGSFFGISLDRQLLAPFHSALRTNRSAHADLSGVLVQGTNPADQLALQEVVRELMRARHRLRPTQADDFVLESSSAALGQWLAVKQYLVLAGVLLPAVGLVVGALVITNVMLIAVAERTREIGVRLALGARQRDIHRQFLVEATTLSLLGAALGTLFGGGIALVVAVATPLPATVAPWSVLVAVAMGAAVGIVSGAYPARRAARLDPITALRAE